MKPTLGRALEMTTADVVVATTTISLEDEGSSDEVDSGAGADNEGATEGRSETRPPVTPNSVAHSLRVLPAGQQKVSTSGEREQ